MADLTPDLKKIVDSWFAKYGWKPFDFQYIVWNEYLSGKSGLIHASTGTGKTFAAIIGPILKHLSEPAAEKGIKVLWITPLRALASDTVDSLRKPVEELNTGWNVEKRTGDTGSSTKQKQKQKLPQVLVTTPESLSLLLSYPETRLQFSSLTTIIVDEWHELLSSKRGVLTELTIAHIKGIANNLKIWGLSATLGNTETAMNTLLGKSSGKGVLIKGNVNREMEIISEIPEVIERFPWGGHLGINLIKPVVNYIDSSGTTLLFTNTRSQTEIWYREILDSRPDWAGLLAIHHGSIDKEERNAVENLLKQGKLKCVVATSSLDLGVDFSPVDQVIQVGSPKGIARFLQRAGRSGHSPGRKSKIIFIPANALEFIEIAAVRSAINNNFIEPRSPILNSLDVLSQHLITIAIGGGFKEREMKREVKSTNAFRKITDNEWKWVLSFITKGGPALRAYSDFSRVIIKNNRYLVEDKNIIKRHRMSIGTITGDSMVNVQFVSGGRLGSVEESFVSRMKQGDTFVFGGRALEYVRMKEMTVYVKLAAHNKGAVPQWLGGKMPLSTELASEVRKILEDAKNEIYFTEEMKAIIPILRLQAEWSLIPSQKELLMESIKTKEGYHLFIYPFEGKLVHEGLASLIAFRLAKISPITFSISTNDYGFELLSASPIPLTESLKTGLLSSHNLLDDILSSLNSSEMAKRQFREIARVAGLIFQGYPGSAKKVKQIQASSSLFYEVFKKYDPDNLLIKQAEREVLERQLEQNRLYKTFKRLSAARVRIVTPKNITPLGFPIMVNRFREKFSTEKLIDRIQRMQIYLEKSV
jgi:ATP-dependent helicase Lhr and Lhr-like helicase